LIKKRRLLYGSDASVNEDGRGSFAWGVKDYDNPDNMLLKFHAPIHGDNDQVHSTRGEMFGVLACIRHIAHITKKFHFQPKFPIPIYTDSLSTKQIAQNPFYLSCKITFDDDADIKTELRSHYKKYKKIISVNHVKAHQDEKIEFKNLSIASKINVQMDTHAKLALIKPTKLKHRRMIPHLPLQKISIKSKYDRITHDLYSNVNRYKIGHECENWLAKRWNFSTSDMEKVEWPDMKYVLKKARFQKKHNI